MKNPKLTKTTDKESAKLDQQQKAGSADRHLQQEYGDQNQAQGVAKVRPNPELTEIEKKHQIYKDRQANNEPLLQSKEKPRDDNASEESD